VQALFQTRQRAIFASIFGLFLLTICAGSIKAEQMVDSRMRLIVLTDIGNEPDDAESMVRLLLYSNDIALEGLVASTSRHLPVGTNPQLIHERVDAYELVLANLRAHDPRYPDAQYLRSITVSGSTVYGMTGVGEGKNTAASNLIIAAVDKDDPRPVWVAIWGGGADLAQALWTVRATRTPEEVARFVAKLRVYSISDQDDASVWARARFPELFWVVSVHGFTNYSLATWTGISSPYAGSDTVIVSKEWLATHIQAKGPLGALYPTPVYIMEGDTPSFLSLIPNGLNAPERPDWGGWGGRYVQPSADFGLWANAADTVMGVDGARQMSPQATIWRWRGGFQPDFAMRMQWSVTPDYDDANHAPMAMLNGVSGSAPLRIKACPNAPVMLSAAGSSDPDGDVLQYRWIFYREAGGLLSPAVTLSTQEGENTQVTIADTVQTDQFFPPKDYNVHVILEVTDNAAMPVTRYRRAIITVPGAESHRAPAQDCMVTPKGPSH
jgi:Protein of unknown function (DUF1593)